jgi:hypothetical protein
MACFLCQKLIQYSGEEKEMEKAKALEAEKSTKDPFTPSFRMMNLINCLIKYSFLSPERVSVAAFSILSHVPADSWSWSTFHDGCSTAESFFRPLSPFTMKIEMFWQTRSIHFHLHLRKYRLHLIREERADYAEL